MKDLLIVALIMISPILFLMPFAYFDRLGLGFTILLSLLFASLPWGFYLDSL